jgi:hypothetical protein
VKRIRGDEPIGVVIYVIMEISQGNSPCSYLYLKLVKTSWFSFLSFIFFLLQNQRKGGRNRSHPGEGDAWHQWERGGSGERGRRKNMVQTMCTHVCKCKNDPC